MDSTKKYIRFVKDYNLPINIFDEDMFAYYRELYADFWPHEAEALMEKEIEECGSVDKWLEKYAELRDNIINTLENSEEWKTFNQCDMSQYAVSSTIGERNIYTEEQHNCIFISIDLKKANFQALRSLGIIKESTYEDFIYKFGGSKYFAGSKYLRQVIFGKLNPKRIITYEKYLIHKVLALVQERHAEWNLFSVMSDEVIFKVDVNTFPGARETRDIEALVKETLGLDVRVEVIVVEHFPVVNYKGDKVDAYTRFNVWTRETKLKKVSTTFYPQVWRLYKNEDIQENDLKFFFEGQVCKFIEPLKLDYLNIKK